MTSAPKSEAACTLNGLVSPWFLFDDVYKSIKIPTVKSHIGLCSDEPQYELLKSIFQHMLEDGTVIRTKKGYRLSKERS